MPRLMPANVSGGIKAFRRACFQMTAVPDTPLARASLIYSESSTSSMAERTTLMLTAMKNQPRVMVGRIRLVQPSRPEGGTHSSLTAKKKMT